MCFARLVLRLRLFMASPVECEGGFDGPTFSPGRDLPPILYRFVDDGKLVTYVYFEDEPGRRSAAKLLTKDEARRIAANIGHNRSRLPTRVFSPLPAALTQATEQSHG